MASPEIEAPGPVSVARHRRRKKIAAVLVAVAVIAGSFFTWDLVLRPRTFREVLQAGPYRSGTEVRVAGTITGIFREESSRGPILALDLDDPSLLSFLSQPVRDCTGGSVRGDPATSYHIGDRFETVLHFDSYRFNGDGAVWAPELLCPFPALLRDVGLVLEAVSEVAGIMLTYNGTDAGGWSRYDIWARNNSSPENLTVELLKTPPAGTTIDSAAKWTEASTGFFLNSTDALGGDAPSFWMADWMTSLPAPSANGTLRFVDADGNALVNTGDRLEVRLPSTGSPNGWETYILRIGNFSVEPSAEVRGFHVILLGPGGPLEILSVGQGVPALVDVSRGR